MRRYFFAFVAAYASVATLAVAQQPVPSQAVPGQTAPGQTAPGQAVPGQVIQSQNAQGQVGQPGQAGQRPGQAGQAGQMRRSSLAAQGQGVSLEAFIAHKLKRGNEAEVELGQLASQRAETDSVKQFAQMMVKEHTEMIRKLDQMDMGAEGRGGQPGQNQPGQNQPGQNQPGQNQPGQPGRGTSASIQPSQNTSGTSGIDASANADLNQRRGDNVRNSESNTNSERQAGRVSSSVGGSQAASATGATPGSTDANAAGTTNSTTVGQVVGQSEPSAQAGQNRGQAGQTGRGQAGGMSGQVPQMLVALSDQTCDNEMQLTREMLEKHKGSDFEMAYIGQQIVQHTCMLAHLQALKSSGPQQLQQLVSDAERATRNHLDQAEKIAKELGEDFKSSK